MKTYTEEETKDITEREKKCLDFLKENQMTPAAQVSKLQMGNDIFADKVQPYLQDTKFQKDA